MELSESRESDCPSISRTLWQRTMKVRYVYRDLDTNEPLASGLSRATYRRAGRRSEAFHRSDPLLKPPAILRRPLLEAVVNSEIVRPMVGNVGVVLRLAANRDEIGLACFKDCLRLLGLENNADGHRGDIRLLADPLRKRDLEAEAARHLSRGCCT